VQWGLGVEFDEYCSGSFGFMKTENLQQLTFWTSETLLLNKNRTMDNAQKVNNRINIPSSQTQKTSCLAGLAKYIKFSRKTSTA
jgi:hypothetical protein